MRFDPIATARHSRPTGFWVQARRSSTGQPRRALAAACIALTCAAAVVACKSPEERAADHLARAESILQAHPSVLEIREAAIELRNAAALDPRNAAANALLGRTLSRLGVIEEATGYLEEAVLLDPGSASYKSWLAATLIFSDPDRAAEVGESALASDPQSVDARLVLAETDSMRGDFVGAERRLSEAQAIAPELPDIDWARARVYEAKIRGLRRQPGRTLFDPADFEKARAGFDAYVAKGGPYKASVLLSKAKLLASWPGHRAEAAPAFREALAAAEGDPTTEVAVLEAMLRAARSTGDVETMRFALARHTELDPTRADLFEMRVQLAREHGDEIQPVLDEMIDAIGDDARAHVVYARALREEQGLAAAVAYLRARVDAGDDDAVLLAQMVQMQHLGGRPADAALTLEELQSKHPDDIQTRLILARRALVAGEPGAALLAIEQIANETGEPDAMRLLAHAQERLGRHDDALASIQRAIATSRGFDASLEERRAELLLALERPDEALKVIDRVGHIGDMTPELALLRVQCEYELGRRSIARGHLLDLLEEPQAPVAAALVLYEREGDHDAGVVLARNAIANALNRAPDSYELLEALVEIDMTRGRPELASLTMKAALARRPRDPSLYALRARIAFEMGLTNAARIDAERALALSPTRGDTALAVLIELAESSEEPGRLVESFTQQRAEGRLKLHRKVILGRLLARGGYGDEALALFEEALAEGAEFTTLKSDTAHLTVLLGGSLDRAEALARQAVESPGQQVAAADVLGRVYMARGLFPAAMYQFKFAVEHARPPNPEYLLHLGQALEEMKRTEEARTAYAKALEIDPRHDASRAALSALGRPDAQRADPS